MSEQKRIVKIRVWLHTGYCDGYREEVVDVPDDWYSMTEIEREAFLMEAAREFRNEQIDCGAEVFVE